ncbi:MAG: Na+/H+ antiporter NhaA, partial [Micrococcales bacterium]|nr:Na+/H+ antiporter NhaA [Micrococcales bacterium]
MTSDPAGGVLLLVAALVGLVWANSPWSAAYRTVAGAHLGPLAWHLDLTLSAWASDGLLTVF